MNIMNNKTEINQEIEKAEVYSKHGLNAAVSGSSMTYDSDAASKLKSFAGLDYAVNESDISSSYVLRVRSSGFIEAWYA